MGCGSNEALRVKCLGRAGVEGMEGGVPTRTLSAQLSLHPSQPSAQNTQRHTLQRQSGILLQCPLLFVTI